jgi:EAL domain-containing protein (putative c-di-GMP-specific phosphodiesterase class I)
VNVSPETITSQGLADLFDGTEADRIVLEVTEQSAVDDYDALAAGLLTIRERGVRLAVDDVGAGFASLGHVVRLAPDFMKLDRTLVAGVASDPMRRSLIERLVSFADEVGIAVIAEGIDKERDLDTLRVLRVPYGQGFHLGRPGPIPEAQDVWPLRWPGRHAFRSSRPEPPFVSRRTPTPSVYGGTCSVETIDSFEPCTRVTLAPIPAFE